MSGARIPAWAVSARGLAVAAALGAATGSRTFAAAAVISRHLAGHRIRHARRIGREIVPRREPDPIRRALGSATASRVLSAVSLGELIADKLPGIPARIEPGPLAARGLMGALLGWSVGQGRIGRSVSAAIGAAAALAGATAAYHARRHLTGRYAVPDPAIALAEDAITLAVASAAVSRMR